MMNTHTLLELELLAACAAAVAALTQPVQTSTHSGHATCDVLRADAKFAVQTLQAAIAKAGWNA